MAKFYHDFIFLEKNNKKNGFWIILGETNNGVMDMSFRIEYAEKVLQKLTQHVKETKGNSLFFDVRIQVSTFWHFRIEYDFSSRREHLTLTHEGRNIRLRLQDGVFVKSDGIRRFDMLFAALNSEMIAMLKDHKRFKITRTKLNERYLTKTPYFWEKIDYYLYKKETQEILFELFGDAKYQHRAKRIEQGIQGYMQNKKNFIQDVQKQTMG